MKDFIKLDEQIIQFNENLKFKGKLPKDIMVMNPFIENPNTLEISRSFYKKFYHDSKPRRLILGINPGRLGAGATGIPFTDTKRLEDACGIVFPGIKTHEPSSVFIYQMIDAFGGPKKFYQSFLISSICPLGFIALKAGKWVNYNYYDSSALEKSIKPFAVESIKSFINFGLKTDIVYCLGTGKNFKFLSALNEEFALFDQVIPLEHPRYIMQYKTSQLEGYITKYLEALSL
jgi:Domain of unknown function (DUF4918)